ncbi:hypothetical protein HanPSC8_Chr06g0234341 [Helianthus annuus]|nr:hypothetical protein HanPSC8_Chr06g0234341 [Helianthus annuus]
MKVSLKLEDQTQTHNPIHFKAKIPIAVFGIPFLSGFSATHHHPSPSSDTLSLSLRTHFPSGPSLKLSYTTPTSTTTTTTATTTAAPFTLTLKSGISLFGSPNNSPLIISANFSFSPQNPNPNPNFVLQFKPQLGSFSLRKSITSTVSNTKKKINGGSGENVNSYGFVPLDRPNIWKDLTVESGGKDSILSGFLVSADTELPVTKRVKVNLRWGVSVPHNDKQLSYLPYLRVNKIKVERVEFDDVKEENVDQKMGIEGEFEMLKGMCSWMSRELSDLRRDNREMRRTLEDIKSLQPLRNHNGYNAGSGKNKKAAVENSDGFEQWRAKKANAQKETKQNAGSCDVENELQKAIKAASSSQ